MPAVNTCFSRALLVCLPSQKLYSSFSPMSQHSTGGSCFHRTTVLEGPGMTARYQVGCLVSQQFSSLSDLNRSSQKSDQPLSISSNSSSPKWRRFKT